MTWACLVVALTDPVQCHSRDDRALRSREPRSETPSRTQPQPQTKEEGPVRRVGIRTIFQSIPEAKHGEMGPRPEETMGRALEWLWDT